MPRNGKTQALTKNSSSQTTPRQRGDVYTPGEQQYEELLRVSQQETRRRSHLNLHHALEDPCQRLLVAMQPGSYLRPHRHASPPKDKCYVAIRGKLGVLWFDDVGEIVGHRVLTPDGPTQICDISAGVWHTIIALVADCLFLEFKPGPYSTLDASDLASWAPDVADHQVANFIDSLYSKFN